MVPSAFGSHERERLIPHGRPTIGQEEANAVLSVLRSDRLSSGPKAVALERAVATLMGRREGLAASSGTAALALALAAIGVGHGDEVVVPAYVCSAVAHAIRFTGASVILADVDETLALSPRAARRKLRRRTRAIVVVHPFGFTANVEPFLSFGIPMIEDCAQSLGASRGGRPAGAYGSASVCSFYGTKMVAAGEGGMVLADDRRALSLARVIRDGGSHPIAFNLRLSDLNAALALAQLRRLHEFINRRREIAAVYGVAFAEGPMAPIRVSDEQRPCFSRYIVRVPNAEKFIAGMVRRGVEAKPAISDPLVCGADQSDYPEAARAVVECASLPIYPLLEDAEVERVAGAAHEVVRVAGWRR